MDLCFVCHLLCTNSLASSVCSAIFPDVALKYFKRISVRKKNRIKFRTERGSIEHCMKSAVIRRYIEDLIINLVRLSDSPIWDWCFIC